MKFADFYVGQVIEAGPRRVEEDEILRFAEAYDPQWFHVDREKARMGPYGGLIASGWHTAGLVMRLLVENYLSADASLGSAGADEIRWPYPVRPGDTLRVRATVIESRRSLSKPDRGIIKTLAEAENQDGRTVMRCTAINFLRVRPRG